MIQRITQLLTLLLICSLLAACGFHLEGKSDYPKELNTLYLTGSDPYSGFMKQLRFSLIERNVKLVNSAKQATFTLNIINTNGTITQGSVNTTQQTRTYTITSAVQFSIQDAKAQTVAGPFSVSSNQSLAMFSGKLLSNTNQLSTAEKELQRSNIQLLFDHLEAINTVNSIQDYLKKPKPHENSSTATQATPATT